MSRVKWTSHICDNKVWAHSQISHVHLMLERCQITAVLCAQSLLVLDFIICCHTFSLFIQVGFQIICEINGCTRWFMLMKTHRNHLYRDQMINFNPGSIVYQPSPLVHSHSKVSSCFSSHTGLQVCCIN